MPVALLIAFSVGCSALAQVALRQGMRAASVQAAIEAGAVAPVVLAVVGSLPVLGGLALYGVSAASWLFVLARLPVSVAYAFMALGFLLTMALGCLLLHEPFTARKAMGTLAVVLGLWLVAGAR
ncbi:MAG: small multi-drug resistant family protein [Alphaproteobacteria bacterium]|nr:small multi-drug resistant family protein [Alphaproteobacteria bacterium]